MSKVGQSEVEEVINRETKAAMANVENLCLCFKVFLDFILEHSSVKLKRLEEVDSAIKLMFKYLEAKGKMDPAINGENDDVTSRSNH